MGTSNDRLNIITDLISKNISATDNPGLFNGKMGICIFLFWAGRKKNYPKYNDLAESLIDQILESLGDNLIQIDLENGLAGIACGIEHLVQHNFLDGETDDILSEIDDKIFQFLTNNIKLLVDIRNGLLGYGFYLLMRLHYKEINKLSNRDFLLKRLLITVVNRLYELLEENEELFKEPIRFDITWNLPLLLIFLSEVRILNIYNRKVDIILNRISFITLSTYPVNYSNGLFLLLSLEKILQQIKITKWNEHAILIKESLKTKEIIEEFPNKNIVLNNGLAGMALMLKTYNSTIEKHEYNHLSEKITERIVTSDFWEGLGSIERIHSKNLGLYSGLAGIGFSLI